MESKNNSQANTTDMPDPEIIDNVETITESEK